MKTITIDNVTFEIVKKDFDLHAGRTLFDCYVRPSDRKMHIYREWENYVFTSEYALEETFGVTSYSCHFFTLGFEIVNPETREIGVAHITPAHNYISFE